MENIIPHYTMSHHERAAGCRTQISLKERAKGVRLMSAPVGEVVELNGMFYCKEGAFGALQAITSGDTVGYEAAIAKISRSEQLDYEDLNCIVNIHKFSAIVCSCDYFARHQTCQHVFSRLTSDRRVPLTQSDNPLKHKSSQGKPRSTFSIYKNHQGQSSPASVFYCPVCLHNCKNSKNLFVPLAGQTTQETGRTCGHDDNTWLYGMEWAYF